MSKVSRRWLFRSAGASIALPWLGSMVPRSARAQEAPPLRFISWFTPNGCVMSEFKPRTEGANFDLPPSLQPLAPVQSHVSVLSGLRNAGGTDNLPGDHARGTASFLTCARPVFTGGADISVGVSVDQRVAQHYGSATSLPSLELGLEGGANGGICDSGYACAYPRNIAWSGPSTPLPKITDPSLAFDRLFGGQDAGVTEIERARRRALRKSVLDESVSQAQSLSGRLSMQDNRKLDEYLTGVRELEIRLDTFEAPTCDPGLRPTTPPDIEAAAMAMADIMVIALECDVTRVITFMFANGGSNRVHDFLGVTRAHHQISHHGGDRTKLDDLATIDRWHVAQFARFVESLANTPTGEDRMLIDDCLVMMGSEISDGDRHNHDDMPVLLAGGGVGHHTGGVHRRYDAPVANLYSSIMMAAGLPEEAFGIDGTGALTDLTS